MPKMLISHYNFTGIYSNESLELRTTYELRKYSNEGEIKIYKESNGVQTYIFKLFPKGVWSFTVPNSTRGSMYKLLSEYIPNGWSFHLIEDQKYLFNKYLQRYWKITVNDCIRVNKFQVVYVTYGEPVRDYNDPIILEILNRKLLP